LHFVHFPSLSLFPVSAPHIAIGTMYASNSFQSFVLDTIVPLSFEYFPLVALSLSHYIGGVLHLYAIRVVYVCHAMCLLCFCFSSTLLASMNIDCDMFQKRHQMKRRCFEVTYRVYSPLYLTYCEDTCGNLCSILPYKGRDEKSIRLTYGNEFVVCKGSYYQYIHAFQSPRIQPW
jgi:hypothetical protein